MLDGLNCTVSLGESKVFVRVGIIIYALAAWMLLTSGLATSVKLLFLLLLMLFNFYIIKHPYPMPGYRQLNFQQSRWYLLNKQGAWEIYLNHRVILEAGLFFLLELKNLQKRQVLVIFFDQLPLEQYRMIRILQKIEKY